MYRILIILFAVYPCTFVWAGTVTYEVVIGDQHPSCRGMFTCTNLTVDERSRFEGDVYPHLTGTITADTETNSITSSDLVLSFSTVFYGATLAPVSLPPLPDVRENGVVLSASNSELRLLRSQGDVGSLRWGGRSDPPSSIGVLHFVRTGYATLEGFHDTIGEFYGLLDLFPSEDSQGLLIGVAIPEPDANRLLILGLIALLLMLRRLHSPGHVLSWSVK